MERPHPLSDTGSSITDHFKMAKLTAPEDPIDEHYGSGGYGEKVTFPSKHLSGVALKSGWEARERPSGVYYKGSRLPVAVGDLFVRI